MQRIDKFLKNYDAGKVLDVATGQGNFIPFILECKSYDEIIALDSMEQFAPIFEKHFAGKNVTFQVGDAYAMPFEDETFDTICFSNSIHHFEYPEKIFAEMKRVLKKSGKIIINEMYSDNLSEAQKSHKMLHHLAAEQDRILGRFHAETYTKDELSRFIESQGLTKLECLDYAFPVTDVFDKDRLNHIYTTLDRMAQGIEKRAELQDLAPKLEEVKAYIEQNGYASASSIFYVGEK